MPILPPATILKPEQSRHLMLTSFRMVIRYIDGFGWPSPFHRRLMSQKG
jgi:hypothetical protein